MKILLFGATGMVGQGVLRACLLDDDVTRVVSIGRGGKVHPNLPEIGRADLVSDDDLAAELAGFDACLFCLGVSAAGMTEADYRRVTYDLTLAAARHPEGEPRGDVRIRPGAGTSNDDRRRDVGAREGRETERALLAMPFKAAFMIRPAAVQPQHGVRSNAATRALPRCSRRSSPSSRPPFPST